MIVTDDPNIINFDYIKKNIMESVIFFLFGKTVNLRNYLFSELIQILLLTRMLSMEKLFILTRNHLQIMYSDSETKLEDIMKGFLLGKDLFVNKN